MWSQESNLVAQLIMPPGSRPGRATDVWAVGSISELVVVGREIAITYQCLALGKKRGQKAFWTAGP